jgi:ribosomal protein L40E
MSETPLSPDNQCPHCGALFWPPDANFCRLCGTRVTAIKSPNQNSIQPPPPIPKLPPPVPVAQRFTYSLSTLMLAMTLIAVLTEVCVLIPWLGIPLMCISISAWTRTAILLKANRTNWHEAAWPDRMATVMLSFFEATMLLAGSVAAGCFAMFVACTMSGGQVMQFGNGYLLVGIGIVFAIGIFGYWTLNYLSNSNPDKRKRF